MLEAQTAATAASETTGTEVTKLPEMTQEQKDALHKSIRAQFNNKVDVTDVKFHFKKVKDEKTNLESKRATVALSLPIPSIEGIVEILENGTTNPKALELLQDAVREVILTRARELVNDDENINQNNFPMEKVSWAAIAELPKSERRGGGISKETWEAFAKDYIEIMPSLTGKTAEQVGNAAKLLLGKFQSVKDRKPVLRVLKDQLAIYITNSANAETFAECVSFLNDKADALIAVDEASYAANL